MTSHASRLSQDHSTLAQLTPEQRERLTQVLDRYLSALENDAPLDPEAILDQEPDLAPVLTSYFRSLEELHDMAAGFAGGSVRNDQSREATDREKEPEGGKRIGDFELIREIGRGGMGVVYEARQISLDRHVAVKLLPFAAVLDAKQIARFKHEAQAAAQLHHPNIVPVFAIGQERGVHYYAMQYIDGQALDVAIQAVRAARGKRKKSERRGQRSDVGARRSEVRQGDKGTRREEGDFWLEAPRALAPTEEYSVLSTQYVVRNAAPQSTGSSPSASGRVAKTSPLVSRNNSDYYRTVTGLGIQAAQALHAAHDYGVIHRDVKPSNLLVEPGGKLWVTDFGLARFQRDVSLTRTGDVVGTLRYMSPEQASGQSALVDHRTDIYSLGVTLYELACLQPAFPEERGPALLQQIDSIDPPRPRAIRPDLPQDLETVILKAMSRERDERYATAQDLAADLAAILEGKPTAARPPTLLDRAGRWVRRRQRVVAATLFVLTAAVVGLSVSLALIGKANYESRASAERENQMYRGAQRMLDDLGLQVAQDLEDIPGAEHVRQKLLDQTRSYYQSLVDQSKQDRQSRLAAAVACGKVGSLLEQLGLTTEALKAHDDSLNLLQRLALERPRDSDVQRQLALTENNSGLALMRLQKQEEGRERLACAAQRQERLLARMHDAALETELASTLCNLGLVQQHLGQIAEAETSLNSAVDRLQRISTSANPPANTDRLLAAAYNNLAAIDRKERPLQAVKCYRAASELLQTAVTHDPLNLKLRRDLAITLDNLGSTLSGTQQYPAARAAHQAAIEICQKLVELAPARVSFRTDLALDHNNLGMLESREGRLDPAENEFQKAAELYESHLEQFSADAEVESRLGSVYHNLATVLERAERLEDAARAFSTAIRHQQAALAAAPQVAGGLEFLEKHRSGEARVRQKLERQQSVPGDSQPAKRFPAALDQAYNRPLIRQSLFPQLQSLFPQLLVSRSHPSGSHSDTLLPLSRKPKNGHEPI